jgi:NMD protein affecting ribosome stability and mRNA decay
MLRLRSHCETCGFDSEELGWGISHTAEGDAFSIIVYNSISERLFPHIIKPGSVLKSESEFDDLLSSISLTIREAYGTGAYIRVGLTYSVPTRIACPKCRQATGRMVVSKITK